MVMALHLSKHFSFRPGSVDIGTAILLYVDPISRVLILESSEMASGALVPSPLVTSPIRFENSESLDAFSSGLLDNPRELASVLLIHLPSLPTRSFSRYLDSPDGLYPMLNIKRKYSFS